MAAVSLRFKGENDLSEQRKKAPAPQSGIWRGDVAQPAQADVSAWEGGLHARLRRPMIVFDLDGTLLDSYEMSIECHRRTIEVLGLPPVSRETLEALNGPTAEQECAMLGLPPQRLPELMAAMERVENEVVPARARLFPGALEMLFALQDQATLCLLTNGQPHYMRLVCELTGVGALFAERAGFTLGITKSMRIREWAQKHAALRAMMVGDRPTDIEAAHQAGAAALAVTYGSGTHAELVGADWIAADVETVCRLCTDFCEQA